MSRSFKSETHSSSPVVSQPLLDYFLRFAQSGLEAVCHVVYAVVYVVASHQITKGNFFSKLSLFLTFYMFFFQSFLFLEGKFYINGLIMEHFVNSYCVNK
ncbi:hypothetical protein N665_1386s0005 [Sinapis alba]|nr:hypothetical protein N665_1386s0005 [Sinapis alba]